MVRILLPLLWCAACFHGGQADPVDYTANTWLQTKTNEGEKQLDAEEGGYFTWRRRRRRRRLFSISWSLRRRRQRRRRAGTGTLSHDNNPPVDNIDNNNNAGNTGLKGLDMLKDFFDWISMLCAKPGQSATMQEICKYTPKFGLVWNMPGDTCHATYPACNVQGCKCDYHPLDPAHQFFWFGVWIPPSPPGAAFSWSGGGVCIALKTNSRGDAIQPGTGSLKFATSLFDVIGNFLGPKSKAALEVALSIVTGIGVGFSTDRSLYLDLNGQPPLLVNARRRSSMDDHTKRYNSDKEYFWQCAYHAGWAFPTAVSPDVHCNSFKGHVYFNIGVALPNVLKRPETKKSSTGDPSADSPFQISDLFSFAMDLTLAISADNPSTLVEDIVSSLSPIAAYSLFKLFLKIPFSIMLYGSATMTLLLSKFSAGLFSDWVVKMAALLLYFRKTASSNGAIYITYSKGTAANDGYKDVVCNLPAAKDVASSIYRKFFANKISDILRASGIKVPGGVVPTGLQLQIYAIMNACTGTYPNLRCDLNRNTVGFGFKVCMQTGAGSGYTAYLEKPMSNPQDRKSDTLVFCFSNLQETEPLCLNLGILLWLLDVFLALANLVLAVAEFIENAIKAVGKYVDAMANGFKAIGDGLKSFGNAVADTFNQGTKAVADGFNTGTKAVANFASDTGNAIGGGLKDAGNAIASIGARRRRRNPEPPRRRRTRRRRRRKKRKGR